MARAGDDAAGDRVHDQAMDAISEAVSGMQAASWRLDRAAGTVASFGGDEAESGEDLIAAVVETDQAPLAYAANARVLGASERMTQSLFDAVA